MKIDEARVHEIWNEHAAEFGLEKYTLLVYVHESPSDVSKGERKSSGYVEVAGTRVVHLNVCAFNIDTDDELHDCVVHEMVHVRLWPIQTVVRAAFGKDQREHADWLIEREVEWMESVYMKLSRRCRTLEEAQAKKDPIHARKAPGQD